MGALATFFKLVLAVFCPPLALLIDKDRCDKDVLINLLLTLLAFIPGNPMM